ncbi:MAG: hypothetical protein LBV58_03915 [Acholeplasmatales bacterium]|jgi:hypothetical protein|nr:hypothetical protein [Acholeplasmatales bacterium]
MKKSKLSLAFVLVVFLVFSIFLFSYKGENLLAYSYSKKMDELQLPTEYNYKDWKQTTIDYLNYVLNDNNEYIGYNGDSTNDYRKKKIGRFNDSANMSDFFGSTSRLAYGLPSYIGHQLGDSELGEGINVLAAIASAGLVGLDLTNYNASGTVGSFNYVKTAVQFYQASGEKVILNGDKGAKTGKTFWYELLPGVLFAMIADLYPSETYLQEILTENARNWYQAVQGMGGASADFNHLSYNISLDITVDGAWSEPDAAAGIAYILYAAYNLNLKLGSSSYANETEISNFRNGAIWSMNYLEKINFSPFYEVLTFLAPYLAARLNSEQSTNYNVSKMLNWTLDGSSEVRSGWGMITENWGSKYTNGLMGSLTDGGGYAFSMNTFDAMLGFAPMLKYDTRFAETISKWILCVSESAKNFYPSSYPVSGVVNDYNGKSVYNGIYQSGKWIEEDSPLGDFIAYEGLRKRRRYVVYNSNGTRDTLFDSSISPYASGDSYTFNWGGHTDYGLYGSSHVGFFGGVIGETNVEKILEIDLNALDFFSNTGNVSFKMYYNPYNVSKNVLVSVNSTSSRVYDTITNKYIDSSISSDKLSVNIPAGTTYVLAEIESGSDVNKVGNNYMSNGLFISSERASLSLNLSDSSGIISNKAAVSGSISANLSYLIPGGANINSFKLSADSTNIYSSTSNIPSNVTIDTTLLKNGLTNIEAYLELDNGTIEKSIVQVRVLNIVKTPILNYDNDIDMSNKWNLKTAEILSNFPNSDHTALVSPNSSGGINVGVRPGSSFGFASSDEFYIDFTREPIFEIEIGEVSASYAIKFFVEGNSNLTGEYFIRDTAEGGVFLFNVLELLVKENPTFNPHGALKAMIKVCAVGQGGDFVNVKKVDLYHSYSTPNVIFPSPLVWGYLFYAPYISTFNTSTILGAVGDPDFKYLDSGVARITASSVDSGISSMFIGANMSENPVIELDISELLGSYFVGVRLSGDSNLYIINNNVTDSSRNVIEIVGELHNKYPSVSFGSNLEIQIVIGANASSSISLNSISTYYKLPSWGVTQNPNLMVTDWVKETTVGANASISLNSSGMAVITNLASPSIQTIIAGYSGKFTLNFDYNPYVDLKVRGVTGKWRITMSLFENNDYFILRDWSSEYGRNTVFTVDINSVISKEVLGSKSIYLNIEVLGGGNYCAVESVSTYYKAISPSIPSLLNRELASWKDTNSDTFVSLNKNKEVSIKQNIGSTFSMISPYFNVDANYLLILTLKISQISESTHLNIYFLEGSNRHLLTEDPIISDGVFVIDVYKFSHLDLNSNIDARLEIEVGGVLFDVRISSLELNYQLKDVTGVFFDSNNSSISFNNVTSYETYQIDIYDAQSVLLSSFVYTSNYIYLIDLNLEEGVYSMIIKASNSGFNESYGVRVFFKVGNIPSVKLDKPILKENGLLIEWEDIDNVSSYHYILRDASNNTVISEGDSIDSSLDLEKIGFLAFNYSLDVFSVGDGVVYLNSDTSNIRFYTSPVNRFSALSFSLMSPSANNAFAIYDSTNNVSTINIPNNGNWGSIVSLSFNVNFSNHPVLYINFDEETSVGGYYLQIVVDGTTYYLTDNTFSYSKRYFYIVSILSTRKDGIGSVLTGVHQVGIVFGATMGEFSGTPKVSIKEAYVYELILGEGTPILGQLDTPILRFQDNKQIVAWDYVENASSYIIVISNEYGPLLTKTITENKYDFTILIIPGFYTINVTATGSTSYYNSETASLIYEIKEKETEKKKGCKKAFNVIEISVLLTSLFSLLSISYIIFKKRK